jgi:hypothetical protein
LAGTSPKKRSSWPSCRCGEDCLSLHSTLCIVHRAHGVCVRRAARHRTCASTAHQRVTRQAC